MLLIIEDLKIGFLIKNDSISFTMVENVICSYVAQFALCLHKKICAELLKL